jgi:uracil-DNA glycosylase
MTTDWNPVLRGELAKPYWQQLQAFVRAERERTVVYPPPDEVFAALHLTPYASTRVLILGQDPYHGPNQAHGLCFSWARQGVLLLNTTLTVRGGQAASHQGKGWETFTDEVIKTVDGKDHPVVFILWGSHARKKKALIDTSRHAVIESAHPSPLSAANGFFGSKPFSRTNAALTAVGLEPVDWRP